MEARKKSAASSPLKGQSLQSARSNEEEEVEEVFVELPYWLDTPRNWSLWTYAEQKQHVLREEATRRRKANVKKKIVRELLRLERMEKESLVAWQNTFSQVEQTSNESELKMMVLEEEMLDAEASLIDVQNNQRKLFIFCRLKGETELKAKTDLKT